jgi:hypothetical protein
VLLHLSVAVAQSPDVVLVKGLKLHSQPEITHNYSVLDGGL